MHRTYEYTWKGMENNELTHTVTLVVDYEALLYQPARTPGPPENWEPESGGEIEVSDVSVIAIMVNGPGGSYSQSLSRWSCSHWIARFEREVQSTPEFLDLLREHAAESEDNDREERTEAKLNRSEER